MQKKVRLSQRLENFIKTVKLIEKAAAIKNPTEIEQGGMVKYFELSFELAWKLLKDRLEIDGFDLSSPREIIKKSAQGGYIDKGRLFLDMLDARNKATHIYSGKEVAKLESEIKKMYLPALKKLQENLLDI